MACAEGDFFGYSGGFGGGMQKSAGVAGQCVGRSDWDRAASDVGTQFNPMPTFGHGNYPPIHLPFLSKKKQRSKL